MSQGHRQRRPNIRDRARPLTLPVELEASHAVGKLIEFVGHKLCVAIATRDTKPYKKRQYAQEPKEGHPLLVLRSLVYLQGGLRA